MNRRFAALILVACALAAMAAPALAWNKPGHMVTGAIAYYVLKQDSPAALAKVIEMLKEHPYYQASWEAQIHRPFVPAEERDLYLFMLAARWADDARGDDEY